MIRLTRAAMRFPSITALLTLSVLAGGLLAYRPLALGAQSADTAMTATGPGNPPVLKVKISSDSLSAAQLQSEVEQRVLPALMQIDGVAEVTLGGVPVSLTEASPMVEARAEPAGVLSRPAFVRLEPKTAHAASAVTSTDSVIGVFADILPDANAPRRPVYPLPAKLQALNFKSTADLSPELVSMLRVTSPSQLDEIVALMLAEMKPDALAAIDPDVIAELPDDLRQQVEARIGPSGAERGSRAKALGPDGVTSAVPSLALAAADPASTASTASLDASVPGPAPALTVDDDRPAVRSVVVAEGDTLTGLAERFGVDPEIIKRENRLASESLTPGEVLFIPMPSLGTQLPAVWQRFGVKDAREVTEDRFMAAMADAPEAVSDLTPEQLLALPGPTLLRLPLPFIMRQPEAVRRQLMLAVSNAAGSGAGVPAPAGSTEKQAAGATAADSTRGLRAGSDPGAAVQPMASSTVLPAAAERASQVEPAQSPAPAGESASARSPGAYGSKQNAEPGSTRSAESHGASITLTVSKHPAASGRAVAGAVLAKLDAMEADAGAGWEHQVLVRNDSVGTKLPLPGQRQALLGALLALLAVLVGFRSWRAAFTALLALAIAAAATMIVLRSLGQSLVAGSWTGLILALGFVVLMTVLVDRSIGRQAIQGEAGSRAVMEGVSEVSRGLLGGVVLALAVFAIFGPEAGLSTLSGRPITIAFGAALLSGLLASYTTVPLLAQWSLPSATDRKRAASTNPSALQRAYLRLVRTSFNHRRATLLICVMVVLAGLLAMPRQVSTGQMLGLVTLSAMLLASGLALIEAVRIYRSHGVPVREALILGGQARVAPIAVAALAMALVILPAAVDPSGPVILAPGLATVIIFGLLVFVPLLFVLVPTLFGLADSARTQV